MYADSKIRERSFTLRRKKKKNVYIPPHHLKNMNQSSMTIKQLAIRKRRGKKKTAPFEHVRHEVMFYGRRVWSGRHLQIRKRRCRQKKLIGLHLSMALSLLLSSKYIFRESDSCLQYACQ